MNSSSVLRKKVLIIGSGASGLICCKNILQSNNATDTLSFSKSKNNANKVILEPIIFEQNNALGGIWLYDDPKLEVKFPSPMYSSLRTNLPVEVGHFSGFPFQEIYKSGRVTEPKEFKSFVTHSEVWEYLNLFAEKYNIKKHIHFNVQVEKVIPLIYEGEAEKWEVTYKNLCNEEKNVKIFDSVVICNGHFNKRQIPNENEIPGLHTLFKGKVIHSRDYRFPQPFENERVIVLGSGPSGIDISIELSTVAKKVFLSSKSNDVINLGGIKNLKQVPAIKCVKSENSIELQNGEELFCDAIILCTGYLYEYPFLKKNKYGDEQLMDMIEEKYVCGLWKQIIHTFFHSLCFVGLQIIVCPFILFDCQTRFIAKWLRGEMDYAPNKEEMAVDISKDEERLRSVGIHRRKFHFLGPDYQWEYFRMLAQNGRFLDEMNEILSLGPYIYSKTSSKRKSCPITYRTWNVEKVGIETEAESDSKSNKDLFE